jgi:type II restriction enzyme
MELFGNTGVGIGYTNRTQQVRMISEDWVARHVYCLRCDSNKLSRTPANTRTKDFFCKACDHGYELKSKCGVFTNKVLDGAYSAMLRTIREGNTPTFLLLEYSPTWSILGLRAIHHSLITEAAIEIRKPLAASARRAGWVGCNIVLPAIAIDGQIPLVTEGVIRGKEIVREAFARLESLSLLSTKKRTWAATILNLLQHLPCHQFSLEDMYGFELELQSLFPKNGNIKPKIRQQLQFLRDAGLVRFCGEGRYERTFNRT